MDGKQNPQDFFIAFNGAMQMMIARCISTIGLGLLFGAAYAQTAGTFPSRPVTLIVPLAPGAGVDIETRLYANKLAENLKTQFLVDYKPGAGGTLGNAYVAKAAPDGYTLLSTSSGYPAAAALYKTLPYDPIKDLAPVTLMSQIGYPLLIHPSVPAKNLKEYLAFAKTRPGGVNFGTSGQGGLPHILGEWLHHSTNTKATFVHYKGGAPAFAAVISGEVDVVFGGFAAMNAHIKSGKVRMIGTTTAARSRLYPDIPSIAEQGVAGYDVASWVGVFAPGRTPATIISKLNSEFVKVAKDPDVRKRVEAEGGDMVGSSSEQFRQLVGTEINRWKKLAQDVGIKLADQ
jgi:tripartite-type tricarboxylate transporter receptor subunit TctC